ncbi:MAG: hypothetical protein AAFR47_21185 [Pseudomonadota bacterium]
MQLRRWTMLPGAAVCAGVARGPRPGQAADVDKAPGGHGDGWPVARPSKAGFDPAQLAALSDRVQAGEIPNVHSVLVEHDGRLVLEKFFPGVMKAGANPAAGSTMGRRRCTICGP